MLFRARRQKIPEAIILALASGEVSVRLRQDPRARRYLLRLPADSTGPVLIIPRGGSLETALDFATRNRGWLEGQLAARPAATPFAAGADVPVRGKMHRIMASGRLRGVVTAADGPDGPVLLVPGDESHISRKVTDWLRKEARADLAAAVDRHSATIGRRASAISLRDTRSRWGSCAANGRLSFSWRLILAPPEILDYVAAHEVAHLVEMNHSDRFWAVCRRLAPQTPTARLWLREHGASLHTFG